MDLFSRSLYVVLLSVTCASIHQVAVVVPVTSENEVYECVYGADPADSNYTWYRQDLPSLPEGTKAEGNRLHFMDSTSDLNGLYRCVVLHEKGTAVASYYRVIQERLLQKISRSIWSLWMLLM